jgi:hypothetical protein
VNASVAAVPSVSNVTCTPTVINFGNDPAIIRWTPPPGPVPAGATRSYAVDFTSTAGTITKTVAESATPQLSVLWSDLGADWDARHTIRVSTVLTWTGTPWKSTSTASPKATVGSTTDLGFLGTFRDLECPNA